MIVNNSGANSENNESLDLSKQFNLFLLYLFIKIGEWYYSKDEIESNITEVNPPKRSKYSVSNQCPICSSQIIEPVFLKCCGVVFCENCLLNYMKKTKICPVSKDQISSESYVKIYE
jgi:hypothetical protein